MDGYQPDAYADESAAIQFAEDCPQNVALMQAMLDRAPEGLIGFDANLRILLYNKSAARMLGVFAPDLQHGVPVEQLLAKAAELGSEGQRAFVAVLSFAFKQEHRKEGAGTGWLSDIALVNGRSLRVAVTQVNNGLCYVVLNVDTPGSIPTERIDSLTGLSDRQWFRERVTAMLASSAGADQVAVLMIDLDRFKAVNDSQGHPVGDALLQVVGKRLSSAVRDGDVVSRLGGDEFAVAMSASAAPGAMGVRLVDLLSRPYMVEGQVAVIGASIGVAVGPRDGTDTAALIRAADLALYQAKEDGRGTVRTFNQDMDDQTRARHALLGDLRRALALQQFEVHYQPQINLASRELVGFEALVRWRHPEQGLIPPDRFIPLAEETGLIIGIGEWVLRTACLDAMSWPKHLTVAVNVSAKQLVDQDRLPRVVAAALAGTGLTASRLEVEITESALVRHATAALQALRAVRAMGVRVSMDDFGTGYSSLSQLRSFPFDKLKIDRSFVRDLSNSDEALAVIRAIAALGNSLGMTTTAEGVETTAQEEMVRGDGCTDMQGYLVSRPIPAGDVAELIDRLTAEHAAALESTS